MKNEKLRRFPYVSTSPNSYVRMQEEGPPGYSQIERSGKEEEECQDPPPYLELTDDRSETGSMEKIPSLIIPCESDGRKVVRVTIHHGSSVDPEVVINNRKVSLQYPFGSKYLCLRMMYLLAFFFFVLFLWKSLLFVHVLLYDE
ncbi:unnamed protein product [Allacma fusca]|uniref:Uncharacterized protein n=1 Tax=Allacma fusca TaxID=39272 RepID=A0A8J2PH01_9HEXA|nr:unnamed protein product [Allacma fusca]